MAELLGLDHLALTPDGPTLSMGVAEGQWVAVYGPAGSGKSWLIRILAGLERPPHGNLSRRAECVFAEPLNSPRKLKPLSLARFGRAPNAATMATEALMATRLWDVKGESVGQLSPGQIAAAELLRPMTSNAPILIVDGQLDRLDPWTLVGVLAYLERLKASGTSVVVSSNRPDLARHFDTLIVLRDKGIRFAGTPADLLRLGPPHRFVVNAEDQPGVRALVAPFSVQVSSEGDSMRLQAEEGQDLAARLLLEGYGNVRFVVHRAPSIEEALLALLGI